MHACCERSWEQTWLCQLWRNGNSFLKFNPFTSLVEPNYPLFPHRDDVPLVDPCSGFVSPGADADLQPNVGRAVESLVYYSDWKPHQQVPITGKRGQPPHRRQMILLEETSQDRRWNSRAVSAASVRAQLRGKANYSFYFLITREIGVAWINTVSFWTPFPKVLKEQTL